MRGYKEWSDRSSFVTLLAFPTLVLAGFLADVVDLVIAGISRTIDSSTRDVVRWAGAQIRRVMYHQW
jgi:hypothetical protein